MTLRVHDLCADAGLVSVEDARAETAKLVEAPVGLEIVTFRSLRGRVAGEAATSPGPLPPFDHSAMDGYALADPSLLRHRLKARIAAGDAEGDVLAPGEAARIFTGAPLPEGARAVVMQERVRRDGDEVVLAAPIAAGANVRRRGEDVAFGEVLAPAGVVLDARHLAILASAGLERMTVRRRVVVGLLSTGDEVVEHGAPLRPGRIHDANRPMLAAVLDRPAYEVVDLGIAPDDRDALSRMLTDAAAHCDAIVTSGATSVGEEDHLAASVAAAGGHLALTKASIKPGKPIVAGRLGRAVLVGLPGNPFAALVGYMLIGRVVLERLAGRPASPLKLLTAVAAFSQRGPGPRTEFAPAALAGVSAEGLPCIEKLGRGGSARLAPLIAADGLAVIPAGREEVRPGDRVGFLPFEAALDV